MVRKALVIAAVFGAGWLAVEYGLGQSWWPVPVSGKREVVVRGVLGVNPPGAKIGPVIVTEDGSRVNVDVSRMDSRMVTAKLNRRVTARGFIVDLQEESYLKAAWMR